MGARALPCPLPADSLSEEGEASKGYGYHAFPVGFACCRRSRKRGRFGPYQPYVWRLVFFIVFFFIKEPFQKFLAVVVFFTKIFHAFPGEDNEEEIEKEEHGPDEYRPSHYFQNKVAHSCKYLLLNV